MCSISTFVTLTFCLEWLYVLRMLDADPQYSNGERFFTIFLSRYYRLQTKLLEGNVFAPVCDSVHGGVSIQCRVSVQGGL